MSLQPMTCQHPLHDTQNVVLHNVSGVGGIIPLALEHTRPYQCGPPGSAGPVCTSDVC